MSGFVAEHVRFEITACLSRGSTPVHSRRKCNASCLMASRAVRVVCARARVRDEHAASYATVFGRESIGLYANSQGGPSRISFQF